MKDAALYLEADEDITSAIDKLSRVDSQTVQIVVPKRSTMLQSLINLKLLKKAAAEANKELVLVTNDRVAKDLAGRLGLPVAAALGAKAVIVEMPTPPPAALDDIIEDGSEPAPAGVATEPVAAAKPAKAAKAESAASVAASSAAAPSFVARELDDEPLMAGDATAAAPVAAAGARKIKVPNFKLLQRRMLWIGGAVVLVVGYLVVMYVFASAKVTLYANATKVDVATQFSVDPAATSSDTAAKVLAGQQVSFSKDTNAAFVPSGKKDVGTKAGGQITISNCLDANDHMFVSGSRFQAPDGKLFRSTADVVVPGGSGSFFGCTRPGTATVAVQADQPGDSYNEAPVTYTIPGLAADQQAGKNSINAKGAQMSGGTSKTITVVTQADVDKARTDGLAKDNDASLETLKGKVPSGYVALKGSEQQTVTSSVPSPAVDQEGSTASLSLKITYTTLAVKSDDYSAFIRAQEQRQIGDKSQIYNDGLATANLEPGDRAPNGRQSFQLSTQAFSGAKIDLKALATQLKGKRYGDARELAQQQPGVQRADITLWPAWGTQSPARDSKITVKLEVADTKGN